jgi:hypothetical protein
MMGQLRQLRDRKSKEKLLKKLKGRLLLRKGRLLLRKVKLLQKRDKSLLNLKLKVKWRLKESRLNKLENPRQWLNNPLRSQSKLQNKSTSKRLKRQSKKNNKSTPLQQ